MMDPGKFVTGSWVQYLYPRYFGTSYISDFSIDYNALILGFTVCDVRLGVALSMEQLLRKKPSLCPLSLFGLFFTFFYIRYYGDTCTRQMVPRSIAGSVQEMYGGPIDSLSCMDWHQETRWKIWCHQLERP